MTRMFGWGRSLSSESDVISVSTQQDAAQLLMQSHPRGITARGLGRSYGDAAINSGGTVALIQDGLCSKEAGTSLEIDSGNGFARIGAGVSIEQMLRALVPAGFFVPVTPGTRFVTLGGAIAADIHGKNHHCDGTFGQHVQSMRILLSSGEIISLDPKVNSEWFWATIGGMGLTGVVLDATIDLIPISTSRIAVTTARCRNIDELFSLMSDADSDDHFRYSVAWVDMLSKGDAFGRGVLTRGDHSDTHDDTPGQSLSYDPQTRFGVPRYFPNGVLNIATIRAFNELWYRKASKNTATTFESITNFFHPLDGVRNWNRMYGSRGFLQYQCVVPIGAKNLIKEIIGMMQNAKLPTFLAVLKRMGKQNPGLLSFPMQGWTLAVDIAVGSERVESALREIDEAVISAGGRHYLAKDGHMSQSTFLRGYPQLDTWRDIQRQMDPIGMWTSDLARRLQLVGEQL